MRLVFTMTPGRTGTAFLAELCRRNLEDVYAVHEQLEWDAFGQRTPEVSHLARFNNVGFDGYVRAFWERKLSEILAMPVSTYVETSHVLLKAGLVEALCALAPEGHEIHLVVQTRDRVATMLSYRQRHDFTNIGNRYLWYLDPTYARSLVDSAPFAPWGVSGTRLWYLLEMQTRAAFYEGWVAPRAHFHVHHTKLEELATECGARALLESLGGAAETVDLPPKVNAGPAGLEHPPAVRRELEQLVGRVAAFDPGPRVNALLAKGESPFVVGRPMPVPT